MPRSGGVLLASNHQSFLDPAIIATCLGREVHFMARSSLFRVPGFGPLISSLKAFPVDRDRTDLRAIRSTVERLRGGAVVLVFPEGTRTRTGEVGRVKAGIGLLARRSGVPIVPVRITGAFEVWPRTRLFPGLGTIDILFGPPFRPTDGDEEKLGDLLRSRVVELEHLPHRRSILEGRHGQPDAGRATGP